MFGFIKNMFIGSLSVCTTESFRGSLTSNSKGPITCVSLNNLGQARPTIVDIKSNKTLFYLFTVCAHKCGRISNTTDDPYSRICVSNEVKYDSESI